MTEEQCLKIGEEYLLLHAVEHVRPGRIGSKESGRWEAIFPVPRTSDPAVAVADPPDVRVWVTLHGGQVEWICQM
jgi:hypothetical protein